jgi:hypothetical protein
MSDCKPSLAFRFEQPAISYRVGETDQPGQLRYAALRAGNPPAWETYSVAPSAGASSLAFDFSRTREPSISYYDPETKTLKYTAQNRFPGSPPVWIDQTIDPSPDVGDFSALAFTPPGAPFYYPIDRPGNRPAIAYYDRTNARIKYVIFDGVSWKQREKFVGFGPCSLAFNPFGNPSIAFSFSAVNSAGVVCYLSNPPFGWGGTSIATGETCWHAYNDPTFPRPFNRGIAYTKGGGELNYALGPDNGWLTHFTVEQPGKTQTGELIGPFALPWHAFSPSGQPAISYFDTANYTIKYAIGTIFRTPLDDVSEFVGTLLFRMGSVVRLVKNLSSR